jgi:hypothetical protein
MTQIRPLLLLLYFVAVILGCSQRAKEGIYIGEEGSYLDLKPDGSFYAKNIELKGDEFEAEDNPRRAISTAGRYSWENGGITFIFFDGRLAIRARIVGDTILFGTKPDERWVLRRGGKSESVYE